jgi:alpha-beta hydrolase superfamily lysophospholipase
MKRTCENTRQHLALCLLLCAGLIGCESELGHEDSASELSDCTLDVLPGRYPNLLENTDSMVTMALSCSAPLRADDVVSVALLRDGTGHALSFPGLHAREADADGDGKSELHFGFSRASLEAKRLLNAETTRLTLALKLRAGRGLRAFGRVFTDARQILRLPLPSRALGTSAGELVDETRENPDGRARALPLRFWYPAEPSVREPAPYFLDEREATANEDVSHRFDAVHASAVRDAPLREHTEPFPLLVMSTGWGVPLAAYSTLAEALAADGYLVIGIEHPGGSGSVVLADGTVYPPPDSAPALALADEWAKDIALVARAALDRSGRTGRFADVLRSDRVGALGHSFGGAAAVLAARSTPLLRAAVNLDGAFQGVALESGPQAPVLFMQAATHTDTDPSLAQFFAHARAAVYQAQVADSAHMNFSDYSFWFEFAAALDPSITREDLDVGGIGAARMHEISTSYLRAFFADTLLSRPSPLLSATQTQFPEVTLRVR